MSYVIAVPEMMSAAATDLAGIGSALSEAHLAAAPPTVSLLPAAADEVSAAVTHLFTSYAQDFHGLAGKAAAFQEQFVQHLTAGASSYASIEAALASLLTNGTRHAALVSAPPSAASVNVEGFIAYLTTIFASESPLQKLLFVLLLPVSLPLSLFFYWFQQVSLG